MRCDFVISFPIPDRKVFRKPFKSVECGEWNVELCYALQFCHIFPDTRQKSFP